STPSSPHIPHTPTSPLFPYTTLFRSLHRLAPAVRESGPVERPSDAVAQRRAGETVQASERLEVLARGEQRIDRQFLGNDAESAPRLVVERTPEQLDRAAVEPHAARERLDQGGLAGAVGPQQSEQLALAQ